MKNWIPGIFFTCIVMYSSAPAQEPSKPSTSGNPSVLTVVVDLIEMDDRPVVDSRGYAQIRIKQFKVGDPSKKGEEIAGFRLRIPSPVPGDIVIWWFDPDGSSTQKMRYQLSINGKVIAGISTTSDNTNIVANSVFKRKYPGNKDSHPPTMLIDKNELAPGEFQALFWNTEPSRKRIGIAYNFTDGVDKEPESYLPYHLLLSTIP